MSDTPIYRGVNLLPHDQRPTQCTVCRGLPATWEAYSEDDDNPGAELVCNPCLPKVRGLGWTIEALEETE